MHWSRIKSILIAVFIIVDAYLLVQYFSVNEKGDVLSRTTIENTVSILEKKDISIQEDIIPRITERSPQTGEEYKTAADALISFSDIAQNEHLTPCTVKEIVLENGNWIITTDSGEYILNAVTLDPINTN